MKTDVAFLSSGMNLAGHLYTPADLTAGERRPAIVVGHPTTGVKEQTASLYAQRLADAGYIALAFDASHQGESEGCRAPWRTRSSARTTSATPSRTSRPARTSTRSASASSASAAPAATPRTPRRPITG